MTLKEKIGQVVFETHAIKRLDIVQHNYWLDTTEDKQFLAKLSSSKQNKN